MASQGNWVAAVIKLTNKTAGRDKVCRLIQYGSKFVSWALEVKGLSPELIQKLKGLESSISTARKLFRLGRSVENFRGALQTIHLGDAILRVLATLVRINRGIYLVFDHVLWAHRMKLVNIDHHFWTIYSNRFWLLSIILSLFRDIYEILKQLRLERNRGISRNSDVAGRQVVAVTSAIGNVFVHNPSLTIDVIKNSADLLIPASRLDLVYVPSGIVGLLGVVSSLAGLVTSYNEHLKLKFS